MELSERNKGTCIEIWEVKPVKKEYALKILTAAELLVASALILFDILIPSVSVLLLAGISLLIRRDKISSLGVKRAPKPWHMTGIVLLLAIGWTLVDFCLILPVLNRLTGTFQEMGAFAALKGNVRQWLLLISAGWLLGAFCEEIAYRGYIQQRITGLFRSEKAGVIVAVLVSSAFFGIIHAEQGIVGGAVTAVDALFFSCVRIRFGGNTWAAILAHGFSNTIGITVFFFTGPLYGLW
jgi:membrane protease YdiL (CAAX protease family)